MRIPRLTRRRRGIAGIIGAVILFTLLFTIGTEYFIFVNNANGLETQTYINRGNTLATRLAEGMTVTTSLSGSTSHVQYFINNTGGLTLNVTSAMLFSSTGAILGCTGMGVPPGSCTVTTTPVAVMNIGGGAPKNGYFDTGYKYTTGVVTLKLTTSNGNVFSATYPPTTNTLSLQSLSSGAIGDLYLTFQSYTYYYITTSGCTGGGLFSGYCLQTSAGNTGPGFAVPVASATSKMIGFSVQLTDLNPNSKDIILDQFTLAYFNVFYGNSHVNLFPWYIANVGIPVGGLAQIYSQYTPVVLHYDVPTTVYFISSSCVSAFTGPDDSCNSYGGAPTCTTGNGQICNKGTASTVFLLSNGWELAPGSYVVSLLTYSGANYGQNSPFVSTLFY